MSPALSPASWCRLAGILETSQGVLLFPFFFPQLPSRLAGHRMWLLPDVSAFRGLGTGLFSVLFFGILWQVQKQSPRDYNLGVLGGDTHAIRRDLRLQPLQVP